MTIEEKECPQVIYMWTQGNLLTGQFNKVKNEPLVLTNTDYYRLRSERSSYDFQHIISGPYSMPYLMENYLTAEQYLEKKGQQ